MCEVVASPVSSINKKKVKKRFIDLLEKHIPAEKPVIKHPSCPVHSCTIIYVTYIKLE